jgi:hypothetical protein
MSKHLYVRHLSSDRLGSKIKIQKHRVHIMDKHAEYIEKTHSSLKMAKIQVWNMLTANTTNIKLFNKLVIQTSIM